MATTYHIPAEALERTARELFQAAGSPAEEADQVARQLVLANLTGHDSHGVIRISSYLEQVREGSLKAGQHIRVVKDSGAAVVVSGDWGYGQVAAGEAMALAVERARAHHVVAVGVTELNHIGRLADYAVTAARAGMLGMVFASGGGYVASVAPFGGAQRRMGTNPIAVGFPSDRGAPVVLDMATSALAEGKFRVARDAHKAVPEGILIDAYGQPSTDPNDLYAGGSILPLGGEQGYKGYLLNFLVEVLGGILTDGGSMGQPKREGLNNCTMMIVLDVGAFRALPEFKAELESLIGYLKASRTLPGDEVLYPGEVEERREAERRRDGVPLAADTVAALQRELEHYGIPIDLAGQAAAPTAPA